MKKEITFVFLLVLALIGTTNLCAASSPPKLRSPTDGTVVTVDSITFSWDPAVPPSGDSVNAYWLEVLYDPEFSIWGYLGNSDYLRVTSYTASKEEIKDFVYTTGLDIIYWQVGVFYVLAAFPQHSETWSVGVLKKPAAWFDNKYWEAWSSNGSLEAVDYQTYLNLRYSGCPPTGYWKPFDLDDAMIPITLSASAHLCWTNWWNDEQQTPVTFADRYRVQVSYSPTFENLIVDITTDNISYTTPELSSGAYYWRVRSEREDGLVTEWNMPRKFIIASGPIDLRVHLVDADKESLLGLTVKLYDSTGYLVNTSITDSAGWVRFSNLTADSYTLLAALRGIQILNRTIHVSLSETIDPLVCNIFDWTVRFIDGDGEALRNMRVKMYLSNGSLWEEYETNNGGFVRILNVPSGTYSFKAQWMGLNVSDKKITLTREEQIDDVQCEIYDLVVHAVNEKNDGIPNAIITFSWINGTDIALKSTNNTGYATYENLPANSYTLKVSKEGYKDSTLKIDLTKENQIETITLKTVPFMETPAGMGTIAGAIITVVIIVISILLRRK